MRIISGKFKGHRLQAPKGRNTRPTADHVRESIYNMLASRISLAETVVLDAFCGTGAFGLEAISRGAGMVVFVDTNRGALRTAFSNAETLGVTQQCRFLLRDAARYLSKPTISFDLIFADPPYAYERLVELPEIATGALNPGGLLVVEHDKRHDFDDRSFKLESRAYGRTIVTIFQPAISTLKSSAQEP